MVPLTSCQRATGKDYLSVVVHCADLAISVSDRGRRQNGVSGGGWVATPASDLHIPFRARLLRSNLFDPRSAALQIAPPLNTVFPLPDPDLPPEGGGSSLSLASRARAFAYSELAADPTGPPLARSCYPGQRPLQSRHKLRVDGGASLSRSRAYVFGLHRYQLIERYRMPVPFAAGSWLGLNRLLLALIKRETTGAPGFHHLCKLRTVTFRESIFRRQTLICVRHDLLPLELRLVRKHIFDS